MRSDVLEAAAMVLCIAIAIHDDTVQGVSSQAVKGVAYLKVAAQT